MTYEGKIYRPWPEAEAILLQVTLGCSNNNCTFCNMFTDKKFKTRKIENVFVDIESLAKHYPKAESIFLTDGNVMVLKTSYLVKVIKKIKEVFPNMKNIALYSELNDFRRKSVEELKQIKEAGLDMAYSGLESGDAITLEKIEKGLSAEQAIEGMKKAKEAGIKVLLSFIFGLGGKQRSEVHMRETVNLLNILQPEEIAPMALALQSGTKLAEQAKTGEFIQATPKQMVEEEKYLIENLGNFDTFYWGDHGNNIVPQKGMMPYHRKEFLKNLTTYAPKHRSINDEVLHTFEW